MVHAAQRREQAVNMRIGGATFAQIGKQLGMTRQGARQAVQAALYATAKSTEEKADELRVLEMHRLDALQAANWQDAMNGDIQKGKLLLSIMTRRAAMLGLDAPTKTEMRVGEVDIDAAINAELARVAATIQAPNAPTAEDADGDNPTLATDGAA